jgi:ABC-type nitrate/sulfonate/bicarbonate transport system substrate-binding protein
MSADSASKTSFSRKLWGMAIVAIVIVVALVLFLFHSRKSNSLIEVRYGITPYQDSAIPIVADSLGWYTESGIKFIGVPLVWGDVVTAISSGAIDVAIYNFNSFMPPYENALQGSRIPVFYCPTYVFKGQAIMVYPNAGFVPFRDQAGENEADREKRIAQTARELKGKRIAITEGTELEQIVLEALKKAGLDPKKDVTLIHAAPEDALAAFLAKNVDAFAAGLTERTEARRHGATELLVTSDVTLPVIDGIITTQQFATTHRAVLDSLVLIWFRTILFMEGDLHKNSQYILGYLAKSASTRYSSEEYSVAWTYNIFPKTTLYASNMFNTPGTPYYWKRSWDSVNRFLLEQKKINSAIPYSAYAGDTTLKRLVMEK